MSESLNSQLDTTEDVARDELKSTATGSIEAADKLEQERRTNPVGVEAVEQEQAEAPDGRGLSR